MTQSPSPFASRPAPSSSAAIGTASPGLVGVIVRLKPVWSGATLWGPAFTVRGQAGDNLALHRALARVQKGDVLVVQLSGEVQRGHWGELMSIAAQVRGVAGLIIDGAIRDSEAIAARRFPTFHRGRYPLPAAKTYPGELEVPVEIAGVTINPGDGVYADVDGIVIVPIANLEAIIDAAALVDVNEAIIARRLADGETTMRALALATLAEVD